MNKSQAEHQTAIDELISKLSAIENGPTLETVSQINRIAGQLQEICGCLYYEHFEPPPMTLQRPYTSDEFRKFINLAVNSGRDYQVLNEDGKSALSGGPTVEFMNADLCPVCFG